MSNATGYRTVLVERRGAVGLVTLNRPQALNALNSLLIAELGAALDDLEADPAIGAIVLTGGDKAFAAGADVKEMAEKTYPETYLEDFITQGWERVAQCRKPIVAAVAGFALGGGCEIAMMCDIVIAADTARFGQPEINIGILPGDGATQRLTRASGKSLAMLMILTGEPISAQHALQAGLVAEVVTAGQANARALDIAQSIARKPPRSAELAKAAVLSAFQTTLDAGLEFERQAIRHAFTTADQLEGMNAFFEKRPPQYRGK